MLTYHLKTARPTAALRAALPRCPRGHHVRRLARRHAPAEQASARGEPAHQPDHGRDRLRSACRRGLHRFRAETRLFRAGAACRAGLRSRRSHLHRLCRQFRLRGDLSLRFSHDFVDNGCFPFSTWAQAVAQCAERILECAAPCDRPMRRGGTSRGDRALPARLPRHQCLAGQHPSSAQVRSI